MKEILPTIDLIRRSGLAALVGRSAMALTLSGALLAGCSRDQPPEPTEFTITSETSIPHEVPGGIVRDIICPQTDANYPECINQPRCPTSGEKDLYVDDPGCFLELATPAN